MVFEKIKKILCDQLDIEEESISLESNIGDELGADSLDFVDLILLVEEEFDIEISDDEIENFKVVGDVVNYIESKI